MDTKGSRYIAANLTEFENECHPYCDEDVKLLVFPLTMAACFLVLLIVWSVDKSIRKIKDIFFDKRTRSLSETLQPKEPMVKLSMINKNFVVAFHEQEEEREEPDDEGHIAKLKF